MTQLWRRCDVRLADFILQDMQRILGRWDEFARTLNPAAASVGQPVLRDHAEEILLAIVSDLRSTQTEAARDRKSKGLAQSPASETAARTHAILRAKGGFTIRQLVAEYRALRASVLQGWLKLFPQSVYSVSDMDRFNEAIDQAVAESVDSFTTQVEQWRELFLGILAHDLRSPLNSIVMTSRLISPSDDASRLQAHVGRLQRNGEQMTELLDDLLDYSRVALGTGFVVLPEQVDLADLCRDEVELLRAAHSAHQITLSIGGHCTGVWDRRRLRQLLDAEGTRCPNVDHKLEARRLVDG